MRLHFPILVVVALALAACASDPPASPESPPVEVEVRGFLFRPETIEVAAGTTLRFTNHDNIDHTVTAGTPEEPAGTFDLELAELGTTADLTFDTPGIYPYFCAIHNHMRGNVQVGEG